jgi:hypothetical protein
VFFEICTELTDVETFAIGNSIRELPRLRKIYGIGRWRKRKGFVKVKLPDGTMRKAETHWYEASGIGKQGTQDKAPHGVSMASSRTKKQDFAVCIRNTDFQASLEVRKLYAVIDDPQEAANGLIRVVDESGGDYLYPAEFFQRITLPADVQRALSLAS